MSQERAPSAKEELDKNREILRVEGARFITYDELIDNAESSYAEYLERHQTTRRLVDLLDRI